MTIPVGDLHKKWSSSAEYRKEYEALESEFDIAKELISARRRARLTQAQVAKRMGTTQSVVARIESGRTQPTMNTLQRYAAATGSKVRVSLSPAAPVKPKRSAKPDAPARTRQQAKRALG